MQARHTHTCAGHVNERHEFRATAVPPAGDTPTPPPSRHHSHSEQNLPAHPYIVSEVQQEGAVHGRLRKHVLVLAQRQNV